jgi:hypothetical protein
MNGAIPYIPKLDERVPDFYTITIHYHDGKKEDFEVVSHIVKNELFEVVTKEDRWNLWPITSIKKIEFDKEFSKIMAIKQEQNGSTDKE